MIERKAAVFERGHQRLAQRRETGHVAVDERAPYPGMQARQPAGELPVVKQLEVGGMQPVEDERLGPKLQTRETFGRVGCRHGGDSSALVKALAEVSRFAPGFGELRVF